MQLRKVMRFVRLRLVPLLVSGVILVSPLSLCAEASVWEGSAEIRLDYWGVSDKVHYQMSGRTVTLPLSSSIELQTTKNRSVCNGMYFREMETTWTGPVDVYIGGYMKSNYASDSIILSGDPYDHNNYEVVYRGTDGQSGEVLGVKAEFSRFTPSESMPHGDGITARVSFSASDGMPISEICMRPVVESGWYKEPGGHMYNGVWVVTSFRIVASESSAELDQLNDLADELIKQNDLLAGLKGDIVSLLQDIYREVGDMNIALDVMRGVLSALVDYVDDVENGIVEINTELDNLYSLLSSRLQAIDWALESIGDNVAYMRDYVVATYELIYDFLYKNSEAYNNASGEKIEQGNNIQSDLGELQKPDYQEFEFHPNDYVDRFDDSGDSADAISLFMGTIFNNSMITSMLMITLSFAMVAYVLYGKR